MTPNRKDIYDREIDRLVKMKYVAVREIWGSSSSARSDRQAVLFRSVLFASCGEWMRCGCPTEIVGRCAEAETTQLREAIREIPGIPSGFEDIEMEWNRSTQSQRCKLLLPFAKAQRLTDKVLKELAKDK